MPQSHAPSARNNNDMADFAGIAEGAAIGPPVDDHAEADATTEIDEAEIAQRPAGAMQTFGDGGSRGVVFDRDAERRSPPRIFGSIDVRPAGQGRRPDRSHPLDPERPGHHHADAQQALGPSSVASSAAAISADTSGATRVRRGVG